MSSHNTLRFKVEYRDFRGLYSAQTLDQASFWRSKMCFQKFIIYILRYTHRKAPFIRTWVLAIQYVRKKKWYVQSNPTSEVCEFGAQISIQIQYCKYNNNCVWSKESHILMLKQNPGTIGKRFKKGSEVAAFARLNLPNEQLYWIYSLSTTETKRWHAIWNKLKWYCKTKTK